MSDAPFTIREQWKEEMHYIEGDNKFVFDCGWGASPPSVYLPSVERWDATVPEWMRGRREEIVGRIRASCRDYNIVEE